MERRSYHERIQDFMWRWRIRYEWNRVFRVLVVVAVVLVALGVSMVSLLQPPTYEASTEVWVEEKPEHTYVTKNGEEFQTLPNPDEDLQSLFPTMAHAVHSRPVAEEVIGRLGLEMTSGELLDNLVVEHDEGTYFISLTYEGTNPYQAAHIVNTVAEVSSKHISDSDLTAMVWDKARDPDKPTTPVSPRPVRNGLLTLTVGLMLCAVGFGVTAGHVRGVGELGGQAGRQGVGEAGVLGRWHRDYSIVERVKEKKLLLALGRRGKLTAVEAALESELSVEEANRMLFELAAKGHLEVTVEHGKLLYSFWERGA